jgi:hypothetical protein
MALSAGRSSALRLSLGVRAFGSYGKTVPLATAGPRTKRAIELEGRHGTHNYEPLPVVLARGKGIHVRRLRARPARPAVCSHVSWRWAGLGCGRQAIL